MSDGAFLPNPATTLPRPIRGDARSTACATKEAGLSSHLHLVRTGDDDPIERGFALARRFHSERSRALMVLVSALNKLQVRCEHEAKRFYWRDKYLKHHIQRIARSDLDMLQWLIYVESTPYEMEDEAKSQNSLQTMIVRYVKELVRIATGRSSFYVGIAMQRLLYAYTTTESQRSYGALTGRYPGMDEYRRAKGLVMRRLQERFSSFLLPAAGAKGEQRFLELEDQRRWTGVVWSCLSAFVPWTTSRRCFLDGQQREIPWPLTGEGEEKSHEDRIEMDRCHALIDPSCFSNLTRILGLDAPDSRLHLPFFAGVRDEGNQRGPGHPDDRLTNDERESLKRQLDSQRRRRSHFQSPQVSFLVDGHERARIDLQRGSNREFSISESEDLIEVWGDDSEGRLLLGVERISPQLWAAKVPVTSKYRVGKRVRVNMAIIPSGTDERDEEKRATVRVDCGAISGWQVEFFGEHVSRYKWASALALLLLLSAGATLRWGPIGTLHHTQVSHSAKPVSVPPEQVVSVFRLKSDDLQNRGNLTPQLLVIEPDPAARQLRLQMPSPAGLENSVRATLVRLVDRHVILTAGLATANFSGDKVVQLTVPLNDLAPGTAYTVELSEPDSREVAGVLDSFSFQLARTPQ